MAIFGSFGHCLPNILHTWPHDSFKVIRLSMTLGIFQGHWTVSHQISQKRCVIRQSYFRQLIGNHTLAFDWCHFWWPWSTFEGHFSLGCHFHVHFSYTWHAFASHGLPAIAELLVYTFCTLKRLWKIKCFQFLFKNCGAGFVANVGRESVPCGRSRGRERSLAELGSETWMHHET